MNGTIKIETGDITKVRCDAIVNAANNSLLGGGGVDGAIHDAAGAGLLEECRKLNGCETGNSKITAAYKLPARYVIHTVGPIWAGGHRNEHQLLASCYTTSLELAKKNGISRIAFPAISTGAYRFPKDQAANIAITEIKRFFSRNSEPCEVIIVLFTQEDYKLYVDLLSNS